MALDPTKLAEATKKVRAEKPKDNYMVVSMDGGDVQLVMPYKDGVTFLAALNNAEKLNTSTWRAPKGIYPIERDSVTATPMAAAEYERYKIAQMLGVTYDEVEQAEKDARQAQTTNSS